MRLSQVTFLHQEHGLWIQKGKTETAEEIIERRKEICKVRSEIREYVEARNPKRVTALFVNEDIEAKSVYKVSSFAYMDSALDALKSELPTKRIRKIKSFPCITLFYLG